MNHELSKAIRERDEFIENNPQLLEYQKTLDKYLDKATNQADRFRILNMFIQDNLQELSIELKLLKYKIDSVLEAK